MPSARVERIPAAALWRALAVALAAAVLGGRPLAAAQPDCTGSQISCSGSVGSPTCCAKNGQRCDTDGTGQARCAACASTSCTTECLPGMACVRDHNGCYDCLQPCSDIEPCASFLVCAPAHPTVPGTYCRTNPCQEGAAWNPCTANSTRCRLTSTYTPQCLADDVVTCSAEQPCPAGLACVGDICGDDPCIGVTCPSNKPNCTAAADGTYECKPACSVGLACPSGKVCLDGACKADPCSGFSCPASRPNCTVAANGTAQCLPIACSTESACPGGQICAGGTCKAHPCTGFVCPGNKPNCTLAANGAATCMSACSEAKPCTGNQVCVAGYCQPNPCTGKACPGGRPSCVVEANGTTTCIAACTDDSVCIPLGEFCGGGRCRKHPCKDVVCPTNHKCIVGNPATYTAKCVQVVASDTCIPACGTGKVCKKVGLNWQCVVDTCVPACGAGFRCEKPDISWTCIQFECSPACGTGYSCQKLDGSWQCIPNCLPPCAAGNTCLKQTDGRWKCSPARVRPPPRVRVRRPSRKPAQSQPARKAMELAPEEGGAGGHEGGEAARQQQEEQGQQRRRLHASRTDRHRPWF